MNNLDITRVDYSSESNRKKTVGITLSKSLVEQARKHRLNIIRVTEQALLSILDYLETRNNGSSGFLGSDSFLKEGEWTGLGQRPRAVLRVCKRLRFSRKKKGGLIGVCACVSRIFRGL